MTVLYSFGWNNFGQVEANALMPLHRNPMKVDIFAGSNLLTIAAGGDNSFAIGALMNDHTGDKLELRSLLTKKFSAITNRGLGLGPTTAKTLVAHIEKASEVCVNMQTKVLYHHTMPLTPISIVRTQFRRQFLTLCVYFHPSQHWVVHFKTPPVP